VDKGGDGRFFLKGMGAHDWKPKKFRPGLSEINFFIFRYFFSVIYHCKISGI
jgi:hypothetical protein